MTRKHHYTAAELLDAEIADLETDVRCAERDGLREYATEQRAALERKREEREKARIARGDLVRVGPAYSMETRSRSLHDEATGFVGTVLDARPDGDLLLARGDVRGDLPDASEWDLAVHRSRCTRV